MPPSSPSKWDVRLSFGHRRPLRVQETQGAEYLLGTPHLPISTHPDSPRHRHYLAMMETADKKMKMMTTTSK